jgi:hypothetical protein
MECFAKDSDRERLSEAIDKLTEENQRCILGVVEALAFAQIEQAAGKKERESPVCLP